LPRVIFGKLAVSKGPGRIMRLINETIETEPKRRFTFEELAAITYGSPVTRSRLVAVRRAVQALVSAKRVSLGKCQDFSNPLRARWLCTVRPFHPEPKP
jgi:hypothetical protein